MKSKKEFDNNEIDLTLLWKGVIRHKVLFSITIISSFILSSFFAITRKSIWEGQFQIVIKNEKNDPLSAIRDTNSNLFNLIGVTGGENKLDTEVEILKSPSILMPVFKYVKNEKIKLGQDVENWRYFDWLKSNLDVQLEQGTSVLNLSYKDVDKEIIIPVLETISREYKMYSGRDIKRTNQQSQEFLEKQINIYKKRSEESLREVQKFAIEQDLIFINEDIDTGVKNTTNIEVIRVQASNRIRAIDQYLNQLDKLDKDDSKSIIFLVKTLKINPNASSSEKSINFIEEFEKIEKELAILRSKYKEDDETIQRKLKYKNSLTKLLKNQLYGFLKANRTIEYATKLSTARSKDVLIKYAKLARQAAKDNLVLVGLEKELQIVSLLMAKDSNPWELITDPTLLEKPVGPNRFSYIFLGILFGCFLATVLSLILDKKSRFVFNEDFLTDQIPFEKIIKLKIEDNLLACNLLHLLAENTFSSLKEKNLHLITLGKLDSGYTDFIKLKIEEKLNKDKIIESVNLSNSKGFKNKIILTKLGLITKEEIYALCSMRNLEVNTKFYLVLIE